MDYWAVEFSLVEVFAGAFLGGVLVGLGVLVRRFWAKEKGRGRSKKESEGESYALLETRDFGNHLEIGNYSTKQK